MAHMKKIMKNKMVIGGALLILAVTSVLGRDHLSDNQGSHYEQGELYRAHELSMDVFATGSIGQYTLDNITGDRVRRNGRLGAGLGLTYFITRNFGIGTDVYSENTTGAFIDSLSVNLIGRFPLGQSGFAPYVYGGGGYQFDLAKVWFAQVGAGIEYRFTPRVGVFLDARWVVPEETRYSGVARLGVRFAF